MVGGSSPECDLLAVYSIIRFSFFFFFFFLSLSFFSFSRGRLTDASVLV
jgi:hypothetical protein